MTLTVAAGLTIFALKSSAKFEQIRACMIVFLVTVFDFIPLMFITTYYHFELVRAR